MTPAKDVRFYLTFDGRERKVLRKSTSTFLSRAGHGPSNGDVSVSERGDSSVAGASCPCPNFTSHDQHALREQNHQSASPTALKASPDPTKLAICGIASILTPILSGIRAPTPAVSDRLFFRDRAPQQPSRFCVGFGETRRRPALLGLVTWPMRLCPTPCQPHFTYLSLAPRSCPAREPVMPAMSASAS